MPYVLSDEEYADFKAMQRQMRGGLRGPGVVNSPAGTIIGRGNQPAEHRRNHACRKRPCRVQKNGGNNGSDAVDCSITYDLYHLDNTTKINTGAAITPKGPPRAPKVEYTPATYGEYFIDNDGSHALYVWNETPTTEDCEA